MSTWNGGTFNAVPWNAPGPAAVAAADAYLTLSVDLETTLTLSVTVAGVATENYDVGDVVRVAAAFLNDASAAVDPTTITFILSDPLGVQTSFVYGTDSEVTKQSTGNYRFAYPVTDPGVHVVRCVGTGAAIAAEKISFAVREMF